MEEPEILILTNDEGKRCTKCKKVQPITHFYRSRRRPDSLQDWCIDCQREYRQLRAAQKEAERIAAAAPSLEELTKAQAKAALELRRLTNRVAKLERLVKYRNI